MTLKETGFRALYRCFCAFPILGNMKQNIADFPNADKANCFLTYGYIDEEAGLTLEVLAAGKRSSKGFMFYDAKPDMRLFIRAEAIENTDFTYFGSDDKELLSRYAEKIKVLDAYIADDAVEESRKMAFLDELRNTAFPDDIMVYLTKEGLNPEGCWVHITGLGDHFIVGTLLNEPDQDFGYHVGETISFYAQKTDDNSIICCSDMNPSKKLTDQDLADGNLLKEAIQAFNSEQTEGNFIEILELLRDSYVWIPCNAILAQSDMRTIDSMVEESGDDPTALVGKTFSNQENIRLVPDILQNGSDYFFPVFSSCEEMGDYGQNFSKVQKHFLETMAMANNNERDLCGIVVNAFSDPFVLNKDLFDIVENMKSRKQ